MTALIAVAASAATASATARASGLQRDVNGLVSAGAPGALLVVGAGGRKSGPASGLGDVAGRVPMRPDDRFRIASLTKTYVATVVLQLVGEGKLRLGDTVERRLPRVVPNGGGITIRQLLSHTSGLFAFEDDARVLKPYLSGKLGHHWPPRALVGIAVSHDPLFRPGTRFSYSSTNYLVAGLIVKRVTGNTLGEELRGRVFQPLGLSATTLPTTPRITGRHAHGYYLLGDPPATDITGISPFPWAAGGIVSTGADVLTFYRALLSGRLLEPDLLRAMETTVSSGRKTDIPGSRYGLGLERFPTSCGPAWGHNGTFAGFLVYAFSSRDGQRQALLMVNLDGSSLSKRASTLFFAAIDRAYCGRG